MPIYEYSCADCGKTVDLIQKVDDPAPAKCDHCGAEGKMSRLVSRTSFVLKGGGWYSDLYGSSKKDASKGGGSATTTSSTPASSSTSTSTGASTPAPASSTSSGGGSSGGEKK